MPEFWTYHLTNVVWALTWPLSGVKAGESTGREKLGNREYELVGKKYWFVHHGQKIFNLHDKIVLSVYKTKFKSIVFISVNPSKPENLEEGDTK